jgi:uncharacterized protein YndB with AHSA1/START domain
VNVHVADEVVVNAPVPAVWRVIKDPALHAEWHPFVTSISGEHRFGATRNCSLSLGGKTAETKERCVAEDEERRLAWRIEEDTSGFLRIVSDWTAGFRLEPAGPGTTRVVAESDFAPKNVLVRAMMPLVRRKFHSAQQAILAGLEHAAEQRPASRPERVQPSGR